MNAENPESSKPESSKPEIHNNSGGGGGGQAPGPSGPQKAGPQKDGAKVEEGGRWNNRSYWGIVLIVMLLWIVFWASDTSKSAEISYDQMKVEIDNQNIESMVQVDTNRYKLKFREPISWRPYGSTIPKVEFKNGEVQFDSDRITAEMLNRTESVYKTAYAQWQLNPDTFSKPLPPPHIKSKPPGMFGFILIQLLPILLLVGLFWFMSSRVRKQMGPGMFGRFTGNRAKRYEQGPKPVTFKDVAGLKNVKTELNEVVDFLKNPKRFTDVGAKIPKGVLLVGPPGTGKTLLARAVAGEAGVPFFSISGSEFIEMFVGVGASRVRELFDEAKKSSPCIIFIDEIDAVGRSRGAGLGGGHDEREQTLNQILSEMDGFEANQMVIVLAATNRPDVLDAALVRPGRFDRQVVVDKPQRDGRKAILEVHTRDIPLGPTVDLDVVARSTIGFSGADLQNLANEAALMAARKNKDEISAKDFEDARDKILLGTHRDEKMNEQDRRTTAYHEAGHGLLAILLPESDPIHSASIIPRGRTLGVVQQLPSEDTYSYSRQFLLNRTVIALGGRAAEQVVFNEVTTGAESDLQTVTDLVERMVCRWGMSEKIGPVALRKGEDHVFLGQQLGEQKAFSEHTAMLIDDEMRRIIDNSYETAIKILTEERDKLDKFAEALLEHETLTDVQIYELLGMEMPARAGESEEASSEGTDSGPSLLSEQRPASLSPGLIPWKPRSQDKPSSNSDSSGLFGLEGI